jgi:predicted oxidoreductase
MARTKAAEDGLLRACQERDELESEMARMPLGGGRTLLQRQRKEYVEARLEQLRSQISSTRMQIKRLVGK